METAVTIILALMLILIGLLGVYSGYKFFKIYLSIIAFIFGFVFVATLFDTISILSMIIAFIGGLIFSSLSFVFYKLAVFIAFASFGASFGAWFLVNYLHLDNQLWTNVLGAVIGFGIALFMVIIKLDKIAIIIITTLLGAYYIITGLSGLIEGTLLQVSLTGDLLPTSLSQLNYITGRAVGLIMTKSLYLVIFAIFVISGLVTQLRSYYKK